MSKQTCEKKTVLQNMFQLSPGFYFIHLSFKIRQTSTLKIHFWNIFYYFSIWIICESKPIESLIKAYLIQLCKQRQFICDVITSLNKVAWVRSIGLFNFVRAFIKFSLSLVVCFLCQVYVQLLNQAKDLQLFFRKENKKLKTLVNHSKKRFWANSACK